MRRKALCLSMFGSGLQSTYQADTGMERLPWDPRETHGIAGTAPR